jgi:hypothetical protein
MGSASRFILAAACVLFTLPPDFGPEVFVFFLGLDPSDPFCIF